MTLESFLKYEGQGAPIRWEVNDCVEQIGDTVVEHGRDPAVCAEADIDLKDDHAATVLISVGTFKTGPVGVPTVFSVTITDPSGMIHRVRRLRDLPMELHRPLPKGPKDLP